MGVDNYDLSLQLVSACSSVRVSCKGLTIAHNFVAAYRCPCFLVSIKAPDFALSSRFGVVKYIFGI